MGRQDKIWSVKKKIWQTESGLSTFSQKKCVLDGVGWSGNVGVYWGMGGGWGGASIF